MRVTGDEAGALLFLRQAIPCILHCENCCGEKFLKIFLSIACSYLGAVGKPAQVDTVIVDPRIIFNIMMSSLVVYCKPYVDLYQEAIKLISRQETYLNLMMM
jgi:hypothetical protein